MADILIDTNIGQVPLQEYLDIQAIQLGYDDYADMKANGLHIDMKMWHEVNDGWFTYYKNITTDEKKLHLEKGDKLVERNLDDFYRKEFNY